MLKFRQIRVEHFYTCSGAHLKKTIHAVDFRRRDHGKEKL